jgi:hypothetical protein
MGIESKKYELKWLVALLLIYCFTDAPLETQYGLIIFLFFPVFIFWSDPIRHNSPLQKTHTSQSFEILEV